VQTEIC